MTSPPQNPSMPAARPTTCCAASNQSTPGKAAGCCSPLGNADRALGPRSGQRRSATAGVATGAGGVFPRSRSKRGLSFCLLSLHLRPGLQHLTVQLTGKPDKLFLPSVRVPLLRTILLRFLAQGFPHFSNGLFHYLPQCPLPLHGALLAGAAHAATIYLCGRLPSISSPVNCLGFQPLPVTPDMTHCSYS